VSTLIPCRTFAGAWIETGRHSGKIRPGFRRTFAGAWIETFFFAISALDI